MTNLPGSSTGYAQEDLQKFAAGAAGNAASSHSSSATTVSLESGQGSRFPADNFALYVPDTDEWMWCSNRSGDDLTVTRGLENGAAEIPNDAEIRLVSYEHHDTTVAEELSYLTEAVLGESQLDVTFQATTADGTTSPVTAEDSGGTQLWDVDSDGLVQVRDTGAGANRNLWEPTNNHIPQGRLENDSITVSAGDGLATDGDGALALGDTETYSIVAGDIAGTGLEGDGGSPEDLRIAAGAAGDGLQGGGGSALAVDVSDFAGTFLSDDGSENLTVDIGSGLESDGAADASIRTQGDAIAGNALTEGASAHQVAVATDGIQTDELDLSIAPTWTGTHSYSQASPSSGNNVATSVVNADTSDEVRWAVKSNENIGLIALDSSGPTENEVLQVDAATGNLGFFGVAAVSQQTAPASLTDNTGGTTDDTVAGLTDPGSLTNNTGQTADDTIASVSGTGDDSTVNSNFSDLTSQVNELQGNVTTIEDNLAELVDEVNQIRTVLVNLGLAA